jgi:hypothetical protein
MAGKKFLNPALKIIICLVAIAILGYFVHEPLYEAVFSNGPVDKILTARVLVLIGFVYLFVHSVRELLKRDGA